MTGNGLVRVDCHLHTAVSGDAVTSLDELAERSRRSTWTSSASPTTT